MRWVVVGLTRSRRWSKGFVRTFGVGNGNLIWSGNTSKLNRFLTLPYKENVNCLMLPVITCRDAGADCDFLVRAETEEEVMQVAAAHGNRAHGMKEIAPELKSKMKSIIKTVRV